MAIVVRAGLSTVSQIEMLLGAGVGRFRVFVVSAMFFVCACTGTTEQISLEYMPFAQDRGIQENPMTVVVAAKDMRSAMGTKVSAAVNSIGFETFSIENSEPVHLFVESAITAELDARGFQLESGGAEVEIHVERFFNSFRRGVDQSAAISQVGLQVNVNGPSGKTVFSEYYAGEISRPVKLANAANAKSSLELAFYDAASKLASDWRFFGAIVDANSE